MTAVKKIGILHGWETTFPTAFVERINEKKEKGIIAEPVKIEELEQGKGGEYAVIIDRISQDVPFYRAYLKNAALCGTAVINNPFWWSADEKFFNNAIATRVGVPVPKTVLLPSNQLPPDTKAESFRNLFPYFKWDDLLARIGFPAFMKPHSGGGWKSVYKLNHLGDFHANHPQTSQLVMMFQEAIEFTEYFRCYCLDRKNVHIMPYEPRNPHHLRYDSKFDAKTPAAKKLLKTVEDYTLKLNNALGYDFNTVEFAVRDGIPYAIDFCNPAPDADVNSVGQENFDWIVENAANMAISRAKSHKEGQMNLTWGDFVAASVQGTAIENFGAPVAAPKKEAKTEPKTEMKDEAKPQEEATSKKRPASKKVKGE